MLRDAHFRALLSMRTLILRSERGSRPGLILRSERSERLEGRGRAPHHKGRASRSMRTRYAPSPRSSRGEGWGEGIFYTHSLSRAPHPLALLATSPRKRGEVSHAACSWAHLRKSANTAAISPSLYAQSSGGTRSTSRSPGKRSCSSL